MKKNILYCTLAILGSQEVSSTNTPPNNSQNPYAPGAVPTTPDYTPNKNQSSSSNRWSKAQENIFSKSALPKTAESEAAFKMLGLSPASSFDEIKSRYISKFNEFKNLSRILKGQDLNILQKDMKSLSDNLTKAFSTTKYGEEWKNFVKNFEIVIVSTNALPKTAESEAAFKTLGLSPDASFDEIKNKYIYTFNKFKDLSKTLKGQDLDILKKDMKALSDNLTKAFSMTTYNVEWKALNKSVEDALAVINTTSDKTSGKAKLDNTSGDASMSQAPISSMYLNTIRDRETFGITKDTTFDDIKNIYEREFNKFKKIYENAGVSVSETNKAQKVLESLLKDLNDIFSRIQHNQKWQEFIKQFPIITIPITLEKEKFFEGFGIDKSSNLEKIKKVLDTEFVQLSHTNVNNLKTLLNNLTQTLSKTKYFNDWEKLRQSYDNKINEIEVELKEAFDYLGLSKEATANQITEKYRKLALIVHPDRSGGSTAKFQELLKNYEILKEHYKIP